MKLTMRKVTERVKEHVVEDFEVELPDQPFAFYEKSTNQYYLVKPDYSEDLPGTLRRYRVLMLDSNSGRGYGDAIRVIEILCFKVVFEMLYNSGRVDPQALICRWIVDKAYLNTEDFKDLSLKEIKEVIKSRLKDINDLLLESMISGHL